MLKPKKIRTVSTNQSLIAKSKSTNDMPKKNELDIKVIAPAKPQPPPPPVNLLKTQKPPLEIHKIEGDKIIIIRRVPRNHRPTHNYDLNKHKSLPSLSEASANQVKLSKLCLWALITITSFHFIFLITIIFFFTN